MDSVQAALSQWRSINFAMFAGLNCSSLEAPSFIGAGHIGTYVLRPENINRRTR
jgi:hypothetical protein